MTELLRKTKTAMREATPLPQTLESASDAIELVEALANAASVALKSLPYVALPKDQRAASRLFRLVEATAKSAAEAADAVERAIEGAVAAPAPIGRGSYGRARR